MTVQVGVVGAGIMGADHARTLHSQVAGAAVIAVADPDPDRVASVTAGVPGARAMVDPGALIADPSVDAVLIASPDATHADLTVAALAAGKPVLCEKPLAPTVREGLRVLAAESDSGIAVSVGFMRRFDPGYLHLRAALRDGAIGGPLLLHCVSRGVASAPGATDESSVTGSAIHEFDTVPWLLGAPVAEVVWYAARPHPAAAGLRDPHLILLRTADGVLSTVEVFLNAGYGYDIRCEIVGERGTLALADPARVVTDADRRRFTRYPADWRPRFADAYRAQLQAWVDALSSGQAPPLPTARDGVRAGAVAEAVIASMRQGGRVVPVADPTEP